MLKKIREFFQKKDSEKGQGVVEYALLLGFVALVALVLFKEDGLNTKVEQNIDAVGGTLGAMSDAVTGANGNISVGAGG